MILPKNGPDTLQQASAILSRKGIIIFPGDTVYGISGIVPDTEQRIRIIKGRGEDKPFIHLMASAAHADAVSLRAVPDGLAGFWPGPLTVILPVKEGSIAVRVPDDPFTLQLLEMTGRALFSTSVNRSGEPVMGEIGAIIRLFEDAVDLIIDGGDITGSVPSTIVDATGPEIRLIRQGGLVLPDSLFRG